MQALVQVSASRMRHLLFVVAFAVCSLHLPRTADAVVGAVCKWGAACDVVGCQYCHGAKKGFLGIGAKSGTCQNKGYGKCCRVDNTNGICDGLGGCFPYYRRRLQDEETCDMSTIAPTPSPSDDLPTPSPATPAPATPAPVCPPGTDICDDPHMKGLRGQKIEWSGVDGGWYCMIKDDIANLHINVRLTAPMPKEFPNRQLITGISIISEDHSLAIEVKNPYTMDTVGCPSGMSPCLANGGLRTLVDGEEIYGILPSSRNAYVANGIAVSASNLPVECRQFGGDKLWARMYEQMLRGTRQLALDEQFEDWILRFDDMAAPDWCMRYIAQHDLADVQSTHSIFRIVTTDVTVRLNVGPNHQGDGEFDSDGRVLPDLEFWQMDVGLHGLYLEHESMSGILGETARPVFDENGRAVMEGDGAFRGSVEDYRVSGPLGTHFALLGRGE